MREITKLLAVSKSSVSLWVRDIELSPAQREALRQKNAIYDAQRKGNQVWSARRRVERARSQEEGRLQSRKRDAFHAAGCMLYWAEGSKERNTLGLSNSDRRRRALLPLLSPGDTSQSLTRRRDCSATSSQTTSSDRRTSSGSGCGVLDLPQACLTKSIVNTYSKYSQKKRINKLPYGTCRLSVHSTAIVQHIYGAIQEYGGFDRPEWLG